MSEELDELIKAETMQFFGRLMKKDGEKDQFLHWLFQLADVDK